MSRSLLILCLFAVPLAASDPLISQGFDHFYNLEYDQAISDFSSAASRHPDEPGAWNHLAQAILYRAMYRSGALESELVSGSNPFLLRAKVQISEADATTFNDAINHAIDYAQTRLQRDHNDTGALYALGIAYGLRSNYNFLVRKAWVDSLHDATRANKAEKEVCQLDAANVDARLIPAVYDYVVGSLPFGYRMFGFLAGFHGNRERGIRALESVAREGSSNRVDGQVLLVAIYRREHRPKDALPLLEDLARSFPRSYLLRFEIVQMYSDLGDKDAALQQLDRIWQLHRAGAPGFAELAPEKIEYLEGNLLFWYNDLDRALQHIQKAAAKAQDLDLNTGVMSWMRLGQIYDLEGQRDRAVAAYHKAVAMAPDSEVGRESREYIMSPFRREAN